jgi:hypothetical protein
LATLLASLSEQYTQSLPIATVRRDTPSAKSVFKNLPGHLQLGSIGVASVTPP